MLKKFLIIVILLILSPIVHGGEYEDALKNNDKVLLYLYTKECSYCTKFNPVYDRMLKSYGDKCTFLKIDASTNYGAKLAQNFRIKFVPFVLLAKANEEMGVVISPNCLLQYSCVEKIINNFMK